MVVVEIFGEPETGKTYCSQTFPEPLVLDFTKTKETLVEILKRYDDKTRHIPAWQKGVDEVKRIVERKEKSATEIRTLVVETSIDLRDAYAQKWCDKKGKDSVYPKQLYGEVNTMMEEEFIVKYARKYNVVFISTMQDEHMDGNKTGRRERRGYNKMDFMADMRFKTRQDNHNMRVKKCRFLDPHGDRPEEVLNEWGEIRKLIPVDLREHFIR